MSASIREITSQLTIGNVSQASDYITVDISETTTLTYIELNIQDSCIQVHTRIGTDSATIEIKRNPTQNETISILNLLGQ